MYFFLLFLFVLIIVLTLFMAYNYITSKNVLKVAKFIEKKNVKVYRKQIEVQIHAQEIENIILDYIFITR